MGGLNSLQIYKEQEHLIGYWINGKPIYRKVLYIASLPNSASVLYSAGITNVDIVTKLYGVSRGQTGHNFSLPYVGVFSTNSSIELTYMNGGDIRIVTQNDRSSNSAYIIIEYTKTTD